jgi:hypothetical protein
VHAAADPGEIAVATGLASRAPDGAVVFAPPPSRPDGGPPSRQNEPARANDSAPAPANDTAPARANDSTPARANDSTPPPAPAAAQPPDLGAMADALYERLERRLRTDLFLERERRGTHADM